MKRWSLVLLIAVVSCGGTNADTDGSGGSGGPRDMTPDGVCAYYADRYCEAEQRCWPDMTFIAAWNDLTKCKERSKIGCVSRLTATGVTDTPARVAACGAAIAAFSCESYYDYDRWPEVCTPPPGQLADGAGCVVSGQCQGSMCDIRSRNACGVCKTVSRAGGACMTENDCLNFAPCVNGICAPHPRLGEPCDGNARYCVIGSACKNIDATGVGTCAMPTLPGQPCDLSSSADECDYFHYCDQFSKTCEASTYPSKIGEPCTYTYTDCGSLDFCSAAGTCQPRPHEGEPCAVDLNGIYCMMPATCIDGTCKIRDAAVCK